MNYPKKMTITARWVITLALATTPFTGPVWATPFMTTDARSAAMGGVGIASGVKAAPLTNPALLAYGIEFIDWFLTVPAYSIITSDARQFDKLLTNVQQANTTQAATQALDKFTGAQRIERTSAAFFAVIPSNILGAGVFFNAYEFRSLRATIGAYDVNDIANPIYNSFVEKRGVSLVENGASFAQVFTSDFQAFSTFAVGVSPKILLWQAVGTKEDLRVADAKIGFGNSRNGSAFNLDVGMFKELGRFYNAGVFIRNLLPIKVKYPASVGGSDTINTQVRAGIAYERRSHVFEVDFDLVPNSGIGFDRASRILSVGGEFVLTQYLLLRAGLRQNLIGDAENLVTFGAGFGLDYTLDISISGGADELGMTAQFSVGF